MAFDVLRITLRNIGFLMRYIALLPLALLPVAIYFREYHALNGILVMSVAFLTAGIALGTVPAPREPRLREGMLIAAGGWAIVPFGSVVLFMLVEEWRFLDALFETMSAWTGTGMSVARVSELSRTTLAWRSIMQWVGGLGVIVLTLVILARPGTAAFTLYASEGREDKLRPSVVSTVRTIWWIYVLYTVLAIGLLYVAGMPAWHAFNHALTGISTAGMTVTEGSIGEYDNPAIELAVVAVMLMGSIAFVAHFALLRGRWRTFLSDVQLQAMLGILAIAIPLLAWALVQPLGGWGDAGREALFQVVSAVTSTGFQTANIGDWPTGAKIGVAGLMLIGGAAGSTAGGIKLIRGVLLVKGALWKLERAGLPHFAVTRFRFGGRNLSEDEANEEFAEAAFIGALWVFTLFVALIFFISVAPTLNLANVIFDISSALGNNGLAVGVAVQHFPDSAKAALIGLMWAGRLEILPVLLLVREALVLGKR